MEIYLSAAWGLSGVVVTRQDERRVHSASATQGGSERLDNGPLGTCDDDEWLFTNEEELYVSEDEAEDAEDNAGGDGGAGGYTSSWNVPSS